MGFKNRKHLLLQLSITFVLLAGARTTWAWGNRGHHLICQVATRLVQQKNLYYFLSGRGDLMGHLCNIPDIYWRDIPAAKVGNAAHFLNPENGNLTLQQVPKDIMTYLKSDTNKADTDVQARADRMGTIWWRAQQFYELGVEEGAKAAQSPAPNKNEERDDTFAFNQGVYGFLVNIGLMGHFIGDSTMPFHTTNDYDGWNAGHGGIHAFYETTCVNYFNMGLAQEVYNAATQLPAYATGTPAEAAWNLIHDITLQSAKEKSALLALDTLSAPSMADSMGVQKPGKRQPVNIACPRFHNLIVVQMARAASALATLWDQAYVTAGSPDIGRYRSYKYPLAPDFVGLDYLSGKNLDSARVCE